MKALTVNETLNFIRGENPLKSMGIGGFSFDTLKPGSILKPTKFFGITKHTGKITKYHSPFNINPENYIFITEILPTNNDKRKILKFIRLNNKRRAEEMRNNYKEGGLDNLQLDWYWGIEIIKSIELSKRQFNYRFEIIKEGF